MWDLAALAFMGAGILAGLTALVVARRGRMRLRLPLPILAVFGALAFCGALWLIAPYLPAGLTRSTMTPRTCAQVVAMGFGTARIGEPGYFRHLDADQDGISCEWWPNRARQ